MCISISLLLAGFGVRGAVLGTAAGHVLIALIATTAASRVFYSERSTYWWCGSFVPARPLRHEMRGLFGWNYLVVTWAGLIGQVPLMILAHLRGPEAPGFYRLATSIVTVVCGSIATVMQTISRHGCIGFLGLSQHERNQIGDYLRNQVASMHDIPRLADVHLGVFPLPFWRRLNSLAVPPVVILWSSAHGSE